MTAPFAIDLGRDFRVAAGHFNPGELRAWLTHPHGQMPDLALTRAEIDDLIAYIEALR